jgi:hypothetical protein
VQQRTARRISALALQTTATRARAGWVRGAAISFAPRAWLVVIMLA